MPLVLCVITILWLLLRLLFLPILIELWTQHGDTDTPFYRQDLQNREMSVEI